MALYCARIVKSVSKRHGQFERCLQNCGCVKKRSMCALSTQDEKSDPEKTVEIQVPYRIERGPTDILKALSLTVGKDYTAAHYKYHDDPYLIPSSNLAKRTYALSKESGRKAAQFIKEEFPDLLQRNHAEPTVDAFMPKFVGNTVDALNMYIMDADVDSATKVYDKLMRKGRVIPDDTLHRFLALLCFYNCEQPVDENLIEENWFKRNISVEKRKTWKENGLAEKIFKDMEIKTSEDYCSMTKGMAKFYSIDKAFAMFDEMKSKGYEADVETYNALLSLVVFIKEGSENRWDYACQFLEEMKEAGVKPNLSTMVGLLELVVKLGSYVKAKSYALSVMSEMKKLGLEPSLAVYYYLLIVFCKQTGPASPILYDIMDEIEGKNFEIQNVKDVLFFVMAMDVCHNHLQDKDLAYRVDNLLNSGENYLLIGDSYHESVYYRHFFKLLCISEHIDKFFEIYHNLVPNTYTPEPSVLQDIIKAIDISGELHYLQSIWTDMVLFDHVNREAVIEDLLSIMAQAKQEEKLQQQFARIALDLKERIDNQNENKIRGMMVWTSSMLDNIISILIDADQFDEAWNVMVKCVEEHNKIIGFLSSFTLTKVMDECIRYGEVDKAILCIKYAMEIGYDQAHDMAKNLMQKTEASDYQRLQIETLVGKNESKFLENDEQ